MPELPGSHYVYRALSHTGEVVYVGVTGCLWSRMAQHRQSSAWWPEAFDIEWTVYDTRAEAEAAELAAIRRHRPPWNVHGLPPVQV